MPPAGEILRQCRWKGGRNARKNTHDLRLTDAERRKLSQICAVSGLRVSAAIREMIRRVIHKRPPQELHDLYVEINRISNHQSDRPESQRRFCYEGGYPGTEVSDADDRDKNDRIGETVMAVTKILTSRGGLAQAIAYVVTVHRQQVLTATQGC